MRRLSNGTYEVYETEPHKSGIGQTPTGKRIKCKAIWDAEREMVKRNMKH